MKVQLQILKRTEDVISNALLTNIKEARLNILFAQFPPYSYEVESLGCQLF